MKFVGWYTQQRKRWLKRNLCFFCEIEWVFRTHVLINILGSDIRAEPSKRGLGSQETHRCFWSFWLFLPASLFLFCCVWKFWRHYNFRGIVTRYIRTDNSGLIVLRLGEAEHNIWSWFTNLSFLLPMFNKSCTIVNVFRINNTDESGFIQPKATFNSPHLQCRFYGFSDMIFVTSSTSSASVKKIWPG